jgi:lactoylglutathione lyase
MVIGLVCRAERVVFKVLKVYFFIESVVQLAKLIIKESVTMRYLHTMIRVHDLNESLDFFCNKLGLVECNRYESEQGRFTLVYLHAPEDVSEAVLRQAPLVELTYNWDTEAYSGGRNFGHLAYEVDNIYATCQKLMDAGVLINRPPRDGHMAFVRSPDGISIEFLQKDEPLPPQEPWLSMENTGSW